MLELNKNESLEHIVVTFTELVTINEPNYLIVFENVQTKDVVAIVVAYDQDASDYPERYNKLPISTQSLFENYQDGLWHYDAYQQSSLTNIDPSLSQGLLESGQMRLNRPDNFEYNKYNGSTNYKSYNG